MMKRFITVFLAWTIMACLALPCYAAGGTADEKDSFVGGDVYARHGGGAVLWEHEMVKDGNAAVTTEEGFVISVSDIPGGAVSFTGLTVPSTETSAWEWMADCIGEQYEIQGAFDFYFEDGDGNPMDADGVSVTMQNVGEDCTVLFISTAGQVTELDVIRENGTIRFPAAGRGYYVLVKKESAEDSGSVGDPGAAGDPGSVGDPGAAGDSGFPGSSGSAGDSESADGPADPEDSSLAEGIVITSKPTETYDRNHSAPWFMLGLASCVILIWLFRGKKFKS